MEITNKRRLRMMTRTTKRWLAQALDLAVLSCVVVMPAGLLFAALQFFAGRRDWGGLGVLAALAGALGVYARLILPFTLRVKRLEVRSAGDATGTPLKLVFFSDIHVGRVKKAAWVRKVVDLVNAQRPDAVLVGGDFVGHIDPRDLAQLLAPLADLRARLGVYAVLGNHDYGLPGPDCAAALQRVFRRYNVRLLRNECVPLDGRLRLVGLDELWDGHADIRRAFGECPDGDETRRIVLGHNPDLMMHISQRAALFLFGHTHGGQIRLPFLTRRIVPIDGPLYRGEHHLPQGRVYITNGCGETTTPTRLGSQVEIVAITVYC